MFYEQLTQYTYWVNELHVLSVRTFKNVWRHVSLTRYTSWVCTQVWPPATSLWKMGWIPNSSQPGKVVTYLGNGHKSMLSIGMYWMSQYTQHLKRSDELRNETMLRRPWLGTGINWSTNPCKNFKAWSLYSLLVWWAWYFWSYMSIQFMFPYWY